eukprot:233567_1
MSALKAFIIFGLALNIYYCAAASCNYIQLNDGMMWYLAADSCMKYQMNNITRSHMYSCINSNAIQYKVFESSDSCSGNDYKIVMEYNSRNTFSINCASSNTNCAMNLDVYFIHGQCNTNNLQINDYQSNAIITDECIKYNPSNSQLQQINRYTSSNISVEAGYRSTLWTCNGKQLTQKTYVTDTCSGASSTKVYDGCSSDKYKYFTSMCS